VPSSTFHGVTADFVLAVLHVLGVLPVLPVLAGSGDSQGIWMGGKIFQKDPSAWIYADRKF
jgi:hypothetical protein